ncbi:GxxExxY protein [Fluviicola sp.]|uniref:GxxExxY protein n=1 Tax=Fluviicola sp. TaxID=1917219 RepID=UPI00345B8525
MLESINHECMKIELMNRNISFKTEMTVPVIYDQQKLETVLRCDLTLCALCIYCGSKIKRPSCDSL